MENIFMYMSVIEGFMICAMLGWEIFWLRRMYQVLQNMPTAEQIAKMVDIIRGDREAIKTAIGSLANVFDPLKSMFGGLLGGAKPFKE